MADQVIQHFNPEIQTLEDDSANLRTRLDQIENTMDTRMVKVEESIAGILRHLDSELFNPVNSVIIFGLEQKENENLRNKVSDLFTNMLKVGVTITCTERATPRDGKPGAVKVELSSTWDKIAVLHAKQKCNGSPTTKNIRIKGCESHADRVNRQNSSFILKLMGKNNDCVIAGNGLIKTKAEMQALTDKRKSEIIKPAANLNDDDAGFATLSATPPANPARPARGELSDNGGTDRSVQTKTNTSNPELDRTNQHPAPTGGIDTSANQNAATKEDENLADDESGGDDSASNASAKLGKKKLNKKAAPASAQRSSSRIGDKTKQK